MVTSQQVLPRLTGNQIANHEKELVFPSALKWKVANGESYYCVTIGLHSLLEQI